MRQPTSLKARAESYTADELGNVTLMDRRLSFRIDDYLRNGHGRPLFIMGPKGSGKTINTMKTLNHAVENDKTLLPAMFVYKQSETAELLDPLRIATEESWGPRLESIRNGVMDGTLIEKADVVVYDDIHYRFEGILEGKLGREPVLKELEGLLEQADEGKRIIFISEDPLSLYWEKLDIRGFDEILFRIGQMPYWRYKEVEVDEWERYKKNTDYVSLVEVFPPSYGAWEKLFYIYGIEADEEVKRFVYTESHNPRSLIRFAQLFPGRGPGEFTDVTVEDMTRIARDRLGEHFKGKKHDFYSYILNFSSMNGYINKGEFERMYRYGIEPSYKSHLDTYYKLIESFKDVNDKIEGYTQATKDEYLKKLLWNAQKFYIKDIYQDNWMLIEPFRTVFNSELHEVPTLEMMERYMMNL